MGNWIVTGASKGLGFHITSQLLTNDNNVYAICRNAPKIVDERIHHFSCNLADTNSTLQTIKKLIDTNIHFSGIINCAGFGSYKPLTDHSNQEIIDMINVNLTSPILLTKSLIPNLINGENSQVINISSDVGQRPIANMIPYCASKYGMTGFSQSLLREYKSKGLKVTLISPGIMDTYFNGGTEGSKDASWSIRPEIMAKIIMDIIKTDSLTVIDEIKIHPLYQEDF
jgi:3-oxoacyl-[acyl-carrier protein] reductase